jgi:transcriptional regulator with XRE-family HTH domain
VSPELELLHAAVKRTSQREVARNLGVSHRTVSAWLEGTSSPRPKACAVIREKLGAAPSKLVTKGDFVVTDSETTISSALIREALKRSPDRADAIAAVRLEDHDDPRANAVATLKKLRALLDDVDPRSVPPVAQAITASSRLLAKLTGQIDVSETMLLRSMGWARIKTALVEAVKPYPEAARALAEAIEKIGAAA